MSKFRVSAPSAPPARPVEELRLVTCHLGHGCSAAAVDRGRSVAQALAAPLTVNTMPEATLKAFADHGRVTGTLKADGGDCEQILAAFTRAGFDLQALAGRLQDEGARSFARSWYDLRNIILARRAVLKLAV